MNRRTFIASSVASAALIAGRARPARAYSPTQTVLRLGISFLRTSQIGQGAVAFASYVNKHSDGRLRVELYPAAQAGAGLDFVQDIMAGGIEMGLISSASFAAPGYAPRLGVFDMPFLFRDTKHARAVLDSAIGQDALLQLGAIGIVGLSWCENGLRHITTSKQPIRTPNDLAGLKIRVPESDVMVRGFKALGADAQALPFPELYVALASGRLQAEEGPVSNIKDAEFDRVQKYLCLTGHVYSAATLMIGRAAFDQLGADDQAILRLGAAEAVKASRATGDQNDKNDIATLRGRGMTVVDDVDRAAFLKASGPIQAEFEREFGKEWINAIRQFGA